VNKNNDTCLVCKSSIQNPPYINLGNQPLANAFHKGEALETYPLQLCVCTNCWHSQLTMSVDPATMFEHYLYISDTTTTLTKYFEWVTEYILYCHINPKSVLEIACNSGLLLEMFKKKGIEWVFGVDPAKNLKPLSEARNLNVFVDYWNTEFAEKIKPVTGRFDLVLAFHVLPHVQDPNDFIQSCVNILSDTGTIFIQTSQCDMFINNEFDVVYHEHSSYFTAKSIAELAHRNGLYVRNIVKTDIHGKSFLFGLEKKKCNEWQLDKLIKEEEKNGWHSLEKYKSFAEKAIKTKQELVAGLQKFKDEGYTLIGYGAAAKGNTLLNYIDYKLDYMIDDNDMKWGYLIPGTNIPIHSIDLLRQDFEKICFVPLAWNFYAEIKERIAKVRNNQNDVFVKYFPEYKEEK